MFSHLMAAVDAAICQQLLDSLTVSGWEQPLLGIVDDIQQWNEQLGGYEHQGQLIAPLPTPQPLRSGQVITDPHGKRWQLLHLMPQSYATNASHRLQSDSQTQVWGLRQL